MATITAWSDSAWQDVLYFRQADERTFKAIGELIRDIKARSSKGHGSPQPLQHALHGPRRWTGSGLRTSPGHRRVHRFVYSAGNDVGRGDLEGNYRVPNRKTT
jgi:Txe/YoeB family toxin of Txe-Axe toxin-antitoxin module